MEWIISATVFLTVLKAALGFNVDPVAWQTFSSFEEGFGYQVVQRQSDLLVSAPLAQYSSTERGGIYRCTSSLCAKISISDLNRPVNMSLGLALVTDPATQNTLACGPTIPKDCTTITMYNGVCFLINNSNRITKTMPSNSAECPVQADIAFLLDGSGSVNYRQFIEMKNFVKNLIKSFKGTDTQFAIAQFSDRFQIHNYFNTFNVNNVDAEIQSIDQLTGSTFTGTAIYRVVNEIFTAGRGERSNVKKVLIVVTDGESNGGRSLRNSVAAAQNKNIVRFAIGVGSAFTSNSAYNELITIASAADHIFKVSGFDLLDKIRKNLQEKIFSIEGSQTGGETLKKEMSQRGFSAAFLPESRGYQMSIVGANQWRGGFERYTSSGQPSSSYEPVDMNDSYLGYSMAIANTGRGPLTIVGAPRYEHRGAVLVVQSNNVQQRIDSYSWQSGEYFGAQVCAMNLDADSITDLILISAPMYVNTDSEGRVYVCRLTGVIVECHLDYPSLLKGAASAQGRFGASLAVVPDLNADNLNDLAVGAPLENDNKGSIYIFHGERGERGINPTFSQRIPASEVLAGLMFFGQSISQFSFDQSRDNLPDLAVGSKGKVVLLRSRPIVLVETRVTYNPKQVSPQDSDCLNPIKNSAQFCFLMTKHSTARLSPVRAQLNYTFTLDANRKQPNNRAYITDKRREESGSVTLDLNSEICKRINFLIEPCPEDALNTIGNELRFTFEGLPSLQNPRPSLAQQAQTAVFYPLGFEINCGNDNNCVDDLKVDFNFTGASLVRVGIDELLDINLSIENKAENSYNTHVILTYPPGFSFRKFVVVEGRIECNSLDSEDGLSRGKTDCTVNNPIFKNNHKAVVLISYGIETNDQLGSSVYFTANATSGNQEHVSAKDLYRKKDIDVKYGFFVTMQSTLSYNNFTYGNNDLQKTVQQSISVRNDIRALNFTVVVKVPVKLGNKDIWMDSSSLQIQDCKRGMDLRPTVTDFVAQIKENKIVDCSVASCAVFMCSRFMERLESRKYQISANLSSRWIEQIGLESQKFLLTSTASLEYDRNQYVFFSTGSNNEPPVRKIEAVVEVYPEHDFTKEIVGGVLGGLALLVLLTAGLYKAGFFKSKYQQMISEEGEGAGAPAEEPPAFE